MIRDSVKHCMKEAALMKADRMSNIQQGVSNRTREEGEENEERAEGRIILPFSRTWILDIPCWLLDIENRG